MNKLEHIYKSAKSPQDYVTAYCDHMAGVVRSLPPEETSKLIALVERASLDDRTIFLVANGGSAAVAGHYVNDLSANSVVDGQPGFRVMSLTDNAFSITALGNDRCFEDIFTVQLQASMRKGDLVILMSVSGNSENLVRAAKFANDNGAVTFACVGFDGGKLKKICQHAIHTPSTKDEYGPVEDMFSVTMHIVTGYLTMKRGRMLRH